MAHNDFLVVFQKPPTIVQQSLTWPGKAGTLAQFRTTISALLWFSRYRPL